MNSHQNVRKTRSKKTLKIPCYVFQQNSTELVFFVEKASVLWEVLQINRREEDKNIGYQRVLSNARVRALSKFIEAGNSLPTSILITLDKSSLSSDKKILEIPRRNDAGWIIDGQHRVAGAHEAKRDIKLPVIAFRGLSVKEQIQQFVTINKEAKGVPTSLYYDLLKQLPLKKPAEVAKERSVDIATDLRRDDISPFFGKIVVTTAPKRGELSLTNFVRKVAPLITEGRGFFDSFTHTEQTSIIRNYYVGLQNVFPKQFDKIGSIFFKTIGFGGLINALPKFFSICLREYNGFTVADVTKIFNKIDYFNFDDWSQKGSGNQAEIEAGNDLVAELTKAFEDVPGSGRSLRV